MRCVRILPAALFLLVSAPSSSADFSTVATVIRHSALAECRVLYVQVPTVVGEDVWAVEQLKKSTLGRRERSTRPERSDHDSEGPRVDSTAPKAQGEDDAGTETFVLSLAALGIGERPDAAMMLALGGMANYSDDTMGDNVRLHGVLTDEEIRLMLQDVPEIAVRMADALIAFSDGISRLAQKLASLFSKSSGADWATIFANREGLRSVRAQQVRHITLAKKRDDDEDKSKDAISSSVKRAVRSTFKIFLGVCIGLIFLMFMRQRS